MMHKFSESPEIKIERSSFFQRSGRKQTMDAGNLYPVYVAEALPGDTVKMNPTIFGRLNTPLYPLLDNMQLDIQWFSVPMRQLWDNWRKFMGEQANPGDSIDFTIPQMVAPTAGYGESTLQDYLEIPPKVKDLSHSAMFTRAYNHIYNEWYRDQNLIDSAVVDTDNGPDTYTDYVLRKRGKRHDYFTSCLPWLQKPDATYANGVTLPLGTTAPVIGDGSTFKLARGSSSGTAFNVAVDAPGNVYGTAGTADNLYYPDNLAGLDVDLTSATAATINQLRQAFQIQKLLERDARSGTRYPEIIAAHFGGVTFQDASYRPEFLASGTTSINVQQVPQTSNDGTNGTVGDLGGYGTLALRNGGFTKSFTEHCIIMGIVSTRADLTYQQGLPRMFTRQTRYDFFWPELQHIGEMAVTNVEIYAQDPATDTGSTGTPDNERVFGYQERNADYKYKNSSICGTLRSSATASLDAWHLSQEFTGGYPELGQTFIEETPPMDRVVKVTSEPDLLVDCLFEAQWARPMSLNSTPGLIDHF